MAWTRDDVRKVAEKHAPQGHKRGNPFPPDAHAAAREEIRAYYASPAGQAEIAAGPRWHRDKTPEQIADLLASELHWMVG